MSESDRWSDKIVTGPHNVYTVPENVTSKAAELPGFVKGFSIVSGCFHHAVQIRERGSDNP